jgi:hypothetical protein
LGKQLPLTRTKASDREATLFGRVFGRGNHFVPDITEP